MRKSIVFTTLALMLLNTACATSALPLAPTVSERMSYRLGAGDSLRIIIYGEDKLSGEFHVSDSGTVTMPLIGIINAAGLTVDELTAKIGEAYRAGGYLTNPRLASEVLTYRPFFILGEVNKPGQYPYIPGMTVAQAIATANGYTYRAETKTVRITHFANKDEMRYRLHPGAAVAPGDTIRVPERHI